MASPLLDTVKQNSAAMASPTSPLMAPGVTGGENTQQVQSLMGTAQTGKDLGPAAGGQAKLSSLGEKLAGVNNLMQAQQQQQQALVQSTQQEQQEQGQQQQFQQSSKAVSQQRVEALQSFNTSLTGMLQDQSGRLQQLDLANDKSRLEFMGQMLRLGNDKYITSLETEGAKSRLDSALGFQQALAQTVFADEESLLGNNLTFRNMLASDDRTLTRQLGAMDLEFSQQLARVKGKSAATTTMWSGIGTAAGKAPQVYDSYQKNKSTTPDSADPGSSSLVGPPGPGD